MASGHQRLATMLTAGSYERQRAYLSALGRRAAVDALFCENNELAIGAIDALRESHIAIGVVGFKDIDKHRFGFTS